MGPATTHTRAERENNVTNVVGMAHNPPAPYRPVSFCFDTLSSFYTRRAESQIDNVRE